MKNLKIIIGMMIVGSLFASCVSQKKYNETLSDKKDVEQKYNSLLDENKQLKYTASNEKATLDERERVLNEKEKKMKDLQSLVNEEKQAIINLKQEVCGALKCFTPDELQINIRDGKLYVSMSDKLLFPSGSDEVNARGKEAIAELANVLSSSGLEIAIEGHTDTVPIHNVRNRDNWDLSVHRATSVARIFIKDGIPPRRIVASGEGKFHAIASNKTSDGRQLNRRTDVVLAPKLDKLWALTEQPEIISEVRKK